MVIIKFNFVVIKVLVILLEIILGLFELNVVIILKVLIMLFIVFRRFSKGVMVVVIVMVLLYFFSLILFCWSVENSLLLCLVGVFVCLVMLYSLCCMLLKKFIFELFIMFIRVLFDVICLIFGKCYSWIILNSVISVVRRVNKMIGIIYILFFIICLIIFFDVCLCVVVWLRVGFILMLLLLLFVKFVRFLVFVFEKVDVEVNRFCFCFVVFVMFCVCVRYYVIGLRVSIFVWVILLFVSIIFFVLKLGVCWLVNFFVFLFIFWILLDKFILFNDRLFILVWSRKWFNKFCWNFCCLF